LEVDVKPNDSAEDIQKKQRFSSTRGWYYNDRPWLKIDSSEILSWNIKKSDTELKTLLQITSIDNIAFQQETSRATLGQAPLTPEARKTGSALFETEGLSKKYFDFVNGMYLQNIAGYNLTDPKQIRDFWVRYGMRIGSYANQYSPDAYTFYESAVSMLEMYGSLFMTGEITVKGDSKYKLGRMLLIEDLDLEFYVSGISHRMTWGESWTTTLKVTRGCLRGDLFDFAYQPTEQKTKASVSGGFDTSTMVA
jgi:hypothetical protein